MYVMEKTYNPKEIEEKWYSFWEKEALFTPKIDFEKKPFTILLPLPNANDLVHIGHAMFTVEDIMVRYHRMLQEPTLWLPGADHAGIETQFVFEKQLAKEGKSRFDFDRETLYKMIQEFTEKNRNINREQLKQLGFSLDWTRYHYSLEPQIIKTVLATFKKLHEDGLIYRGERIVNYCTKCGTAFSDLEIKYIERKDPLYYIKYGPFVLATTRPETKFGDTAVAFHPGDKRYEKYLGQEIEIKGVNGPFKVAVIADDAIDSDFGTGIEKVTPGHDAMDFEIGQRHHLPVKKVIEPNGRLNELAGRFAGMTVNQARKAVFEAMEKMNLIDHVDEDYVHSVATCYRCGTIIEPMVIPQWFVKIKPLAEPAIEAVREGKTKIIPKKRFEKMYFDWMENIHDWNISRQVVWGPRIPVWYCLDCNPDLIINFINSKGEKISGTYQELKKNYSLKEIKKGLQNLLAGDKPVYSLAEGPCEKCQSGAVLQETDTFDTWFLSGQWPLTTLDYPDNPDFKYFYPTSVLDTMWDILFFWVARMMMFGLYLAKDVPFKVIHLHARVVDKFGQKMSKSKGNVINPIEMVEKYGADALRMSLIYGVAPAADVCLSDDKIRAMRNFANKIWNIGRFIIDFKPVNAPSLNPCKLPSNPNADDKQIIEQLRQLTEKVTKSLNKYRFNDAAESLYEFIWHEFADKYIESTKDRRKEVQETLEYVLKTCLELLHPFMPFITEEVWQRLPHKEKSIMVAKWPKSIKNS